MSEVDVRRDWLRACEAFSARAEANRQPNDALFAIAARYRRLSDENRTVVDQLLIEQLAAPDENVRFDALWLIDEFRIRSAVPALRRLADWLETQEDPGAPYEWAKVNRLIGVLVEHPNGA